MASKEWGESTSFPFFLYCFVLHTMDCHNQCDVDASMPSFSSLRTTAEPNVTKTAAAHHHHQSAESCSFVYPSSAMPACPFPARPMQQSLDGAHAAAAGSSSSGGLATSYTMGRMTNDRGKCVCVRVNGVLPMLTIMQQQQKQQQPYPRSLRQKHQYVSTIQFTSILPIVAPFTHTIFESTNPLISHRDGLLARTTKLNISSYGWINLP